MSEALVAERTSTGLSDALESLGSKTSGTGRMSLGRSTINPYETLAANAPGVQRYTTGDERYAWQGVCWLGLNNMPNCNDFLMPMSADSR